MQRQPKSGGMKKIGRNKERCARYRGEHRSEKNKIRRILQSNGVAEAETYAGRFGMMGYLHRLPAYQKKTQ